MIFIITGSQKFQFNRLLKKIDELVQDETIIDEVYAQIGYSDYKPQNYSYKDFVDRDTFKELTDKSDIILTHGGTGAIVGSIKKNKRVIAIPRLYQYKEHVDDHQEQIIKCFEKMELILGCYDIEELGDIYKNIKQKNFKQYISNTPTIISSIENFIINEKRDGSIR